MVEGVGTMPARIQANGCSSESASPSPSQMLRKRHQHRGRIAVFPNPLLLSIYFIRNLHAPRVRVFEILVTRFSCTFVLLNRAIAPSCPCCIIANRKEKSFDNCCLLSLSFSLPNHQISVDHFFIVETSVMSTLVPPSFRTFRFMYTFCYLRIPHLPSF